MKIKTVVKKIKIFIKWSFAILKFFLRHPLKTLRAISKWCWATLPRRVISSITIIVLVIGPISFLIKPKQAEAAWWNDSWAYRKSIGITNNTTAETNIYVSLTLDTSDTTKFQTDCGDLRFTQALGKVMPYYIYSGCGTASTVVYVNFDTFPAGQQSIYYYYGNPNAANGFSALSGSGSVTQANMKLSIVNGTAFADFSAANTLTPYAGNKVVISDSANKKLTGYIKTVGTGETFGSELCTNGNMEVDSGWNNDGSPSTNALSTEQVYSGTYSRKLVANTGDGAYHSAISVTNGWLMKYAASAYPVTITTARLIYNDAGYRYFNANVIGDGLGVWSGLTHDAWNTSSVYFTDVTTNGQAIIYTGLGTTGTEYYDDVSLKQVLTPSTTGVTITSTSNGGTYNWANEESGFNRNDSSNYTYKIYPSAFSTEGSNYTVGTLGAEEKSTGPAAYWAFDEGYGIIARDESSNKNDGNFGAGAAAPTWKPESECVSGKCLWFDGSDDVVDMGNPTNLSGFSTFTIGAWVKINSTPGYDYFIVGKELDYKLDIDTNRNVWFNLNAGGWGGFKSATTLSENTWYFIEATYDGSICKIFINGKQDTNTYNTSGSITSNTRNITVGARDLGGSTYTDFLKGQIDEPKIYSYARTAAQIKMDYNSANEGSNDGLETALGGASEKWMTNGLVGNWKMDEVSGTSVADASGNGNTGTLTNAQETLTAEAASTSIAVVDSDNANLSSTDDVYNGMWLHANSYPGGCTLNQNGADSYRYITAYNGTTKTFTLDSGFYNGQEGDNCVFEVRHQTPGKIGNDLAFDGVNDYVSVANESNFDFTQQFSLSAWIKVPSTFTSFAGLITKYSTAGWDMDIQNGQLRMGLRGTNYIATNLVGPALNDNLWHYVTVACTTNRIKIYVDGIYYPAYDNSDVGTWSGDTNDLPVVIGVRDGSYAQINLDEVRIYNRALSSDEVQKLYIWAPGPVDWLKMDEKVKGDGKTLYDTSGNGNNGTTHYGTNTTGMDCTVSGKLGTGCQFDGVDDYVDSAPVSTPTAFTALAWWKRNGDSGGSIGDTYHQIVANINGGGAYGNGLYVSKDGTSFKGNIGINATVNIDSQNMNISASGWHQIGFMWDGLNLYPIADGIIGPATAAIGQLNYGSYNLTIGRTDSPYYLANGIIDDVRIYNYARTAQQIQMDYAGQTPGTDKQLADPVAYYKFDEGYGDAHNEGTGGTALSGVRTEAAWTKSGKFGSALDFDGSNDVVTVTNASAIDLNDNLANGFSVSAWVNADSDGEGDTGQIFWKGANNYLRVSGQSGSNLNIDGSVDLATTDATKSLTAPITTGTWNHIVMAYNSSTAQITIYVNGKNMGSSTNGVGATAAESNNLLIGGTTTANFDGKIDEFKVYSYPLTDDDARADYNRGSAMQLGSSGSVSGTGAPTNSASGDYCVPGDTTACAGPVGEWKMDEKVSGNNKTLYDTSGNGNDGTTHYGANTAGMDCTVPGKMGSGCSFDGVDDYVGLSASLPFSPPLTYEGWVYLPAYTTHAYDAIISTGDILRGLILSGGNHWAVLEVPSGPAYATDPDLAPLNRWTHVAGTVTADGIKKIYVNGVLKNTNQDTNGGASTGGFIGMGAGWTSPVSALKAKIDQVRVYNYARTPAQIAWDYNKGKPIAEWRMNECQGNLVHDESGNGNTGTINLGGSGQTAMGTCTENANTPWWNGKTGKYGASLNFDGSDDYVSTGNTTKLDMTDEVSVSAWVKGSSLSSNQFLIDSRSVAGSGFYLLYDNNFYFYINNTTGALASFTAANDTWYHVVGTYNKNLGSQNIKIYVNGVLKGTQDYTSAITGTNRETAIGARYDTHNFGFPGQIDDTKVFNYALTPLQVKSLYNNSSAIQF